LLANVLLDEVDKEMERRGHAFVRYADDLRVYVGWQKAGQRVMGSLVRLFGRLRLRINPAESAVDRAWHRPVRTRMPGVVWEGRPSQCPAPLARLRMGRGLSGE